VLLSLPSGDRHSPSNTDGTDLRCGALSPPTQWISAVRKLNFATHLRPDYLADSPLCPPNIARPSFRRIQDYVKAIISGHTSRRFPSAAFSDEQGRLTVYLSRLPSAPADIRAQLQLKLKSILEELDRMADTSTGPGAAGQPSPFHVINVY